MGFFDDLEKFFDGLTTTVEWLPYILIGGLAIAGGTLVLRSVEDVEGAREKQE